MFGPELRTMGLLAVLAVFALLVGALVLTHGLGRVREGVRDLGAWRLGQGFLTLLAVTFVLLVFGSAVRVNGAGLACPDWPLCFGQVIPQFNFGVFLEWGHRVMAGGISLGFVWLAWRGWRLPTRVPGLRLLLGLAAAMLGVQVVLGGLTVLELLAEWTVTSHLLGGNAFALLLLLIALSLRERARPVQRPSISVAVRPLVALLAGLLLLQLALGGLVASSHAGLACGSWPTCNGASWFPTFSGIVGLQVSHRLAAYVLLATALIVALVVRRGAAGRTARLVAGLMVLQSALGVANVLMQMPLEITLLHSAGAAASVLAVTRLNFEVWRSPVRQLAPVPQPISAEAR